MSVDQIFETSVDIKWLLQKLTNGKLPANARLTSWSAEKIGQGTGFLSHIIKVKLSWSRKNTGNLPKSAVLKIPTMESIDAITDELDPEHQGDGIPAAFASDVHNIECAFYSLWTHEPPPCRIPKSFYMEPVSKDSTGILVLEDLSSTGTLLSVYDGLNLKQMLHIADNIAGIQAWSLTHGGWEQKLPLPDRKNLEPFPAMIRTLYDGLQSYPDIFPPDTLDALRKTCSTVDDICYVQAVHKEFNMPPVLVHGDLWMNNILLKRKVIGEPTDEVLAFIDWQMAHPGNAAEDFAQCIWSSAQEDVRRNHLQTIFTHYYAKLKEFIRKDPPFSYDQLMKCWVRMTKYALFASVGPLIVMVNEDPTICGDKEKTDNMMIRIRHIIDDALPLL